MLGMALNCLEWFGLVWDGLSAGDGLECLGVVLEGLGAWDGLAGFGMLWTSLGRFYLNASALLSSTSLCMHTSVFIYMLSQALGGSGNLWGIY